MTIIFRLNKWLQEVEKYCMGSGKEVVKLLVGNIIKTNIIIVNIFINYKHSHHYSIINVIISVITTNLGNKIDKQRQVSREQAASWARSRDMLYLEASAKTSGGIIISIIIAKRSYQYHCY